MLERDGDLWYLVYSHCSEKLFSVTHKTITLEPENLLSISINKQAKQNKKRFEKKNRYISFCNSRVQCVNIQLKIKKEIRKKQTRNAQIPGHYTFPSNTSELDHDHFDLMHFFLVTFQTEFQ